MSKPSKSFLERCLNLLRPKRLAETLFEDAIHERKSSAKTEEDLRSAIQSAKRMRDEALQLAESPRGAI